MKSWTRNLLPYWVVLLAFALRLYRLDMVRFPHDFAIPYSDGITIIEAISAGRWHDLPLLGLSSGVRVLNPIGSSYLWALIALLDRSPMLAMLISIALNTLAVAMTFDLGRRLLNRHSALIAATLMTCSIYGVYIARGTWIQGQLEFGAVCAAWLLWLGLQWGQARRVLTAFVFIALFLHTYLVAMGLAALAMGSGLLTLLWPRNINAVVKRSIVLGSGICVISLSGFGLLLLTQGQASLSDFNVTYVQPTSIATRNPWDTLIYALLPVNGTDFDYNRIIDGSWAYRADDAHPNWNLAFSMLVNGLIALGIVRLLWATRQSNQKKSMDNNSTALGYAITVLWFILPVMVGLIAMWRLPTLVMRQQYLLLSAPAGYLLAGAALAPLRRGHHVGRACTAGVIGLALINGPPRILANINVIAAHPYYDRVDFLPLGVQVQLGQLWRAKCSEIANPQVRGWTASLWRTQQHIQAGGSQLNGQSNVWEIPPQGGTCVTRIGAEPAPPHSAPITLTLSDGTQLITHRSLPIQKNNLPSSNKQLWLNLNWRLLQTTAPNIAQAGTSITLTEVWRIEQLPSGDFSHWDYTLYLNLKTPAGMVVPLIENGLLPNGHIWRIGDYIFSELYATLPPTLSPGNYELQLSLYDRTRKDTAIHVELNPRGEPDWNKLHPYLSFPLQLKTLS